MARLLIGLRLATLRHSLRGMGAFWALIGAALVVVFTTIGRQDAIDSADLLAVKFAIWTLGWLGATMFVGAGDATIPPAYLRLLGIPARRLVLGLLGAALLGIGPILSLILLAQLPIYAGGFGVGPLLIALPAMLLQLIVTILLARVGGELLAAAVHSRSRAIIAALFSATITAVGASGWALVPTLNRLRESGFSTIVSVILRALPTGWGVLAVEGARDGDWALALGAFVGLLLFCGALLLAWATLLERQTIARGGRLTPGGSRLTARFLPQAFADSPVGAVTLRELRSWWRDLTRIGYLAFALFYGLIVCLLPLTSGWAGMVPWTGILVAVMAAAVSANLYGVDGSALWLTLLTPGAARADVRGRQLAWLLTIGPATLLLTVALAMVSGQGGSWPWLMAIYPAALGATVGLIVLLGLLHLIPTRDPHRRVGNLLDDGIDPLQVVLMVALSALAALPAGVTVLLGTRLDLPFLTWLGGPVGIVTGTLYAWGFGLLATRRLDARGPELLLAMRRGLPARTAGWSIPSRPAAPVGTDWLAPIWQALQRCRGQAAALGSLWLLGFVGIFQGVGGLAHLLGGADARRPFLPLYFLVPRDLWQPVSIAMLTVGLLACCIFTVLVRQRPAQN